MGLLIFMFFLISSTFMHKSKAILYFSRFLLLILLTPLINCKFAPAHAMQTVVATANTIESFAVVSLMHTDQKPSHKNHEHSGECHVCSNCTCHVLLPVQTIMLDFKPVITSFCSFKIIAGLPEVTLSRFIPPRNVA